MANIIHVFVELFMSYFVSVFSAKEEKFKLEKVEQWSIKGISGQGSKITSSLLEYFQYFGQLENEVKREQSFTTLKHVSLGYGLFKLVILKKQRTSELALTFPLNAWKNLDSSPAPGKT